MTAKAPAVSVSVELVLEGSAELVSAVLAVSASAGLALEVSAVLVLVSVCLRSQHPPSMASCSHCCTSR